MIALLDPDADILTFSNRPAKVKCCEAVRAGSQAVAGEMGERLAGGQKRGL